MRLLRLLEMSVIIVACMPNREGSECHRDDKRKPAVQEADSDGLRPAVSRAGLQKDDGLRRLSSRRRFPTVSFQNIFRAKDGVLTELVEFMFSNQFAMARSTAGAQLPPVYVYAVETAIQMTLTELNENLREIYIEAYTQKEASDYIFRETAKEL